MLLRLSQKKIKKETNKVEQFKTKKTHFKISLKISSILRVFPPGGTASYPPVRVGGVFGEASRHQENGV